MRNDVGFGGWRFDFVKGYSGHFTKEYIEASKPYIAFGEYWDTCSYRDGVLDYNQDSHRQRTVNWIDAAGGLSSAFDFTTKGILQVWNIYIYMCVCVCVCASRCLSKLSRRLCF